MALEKECDILLYEISEMQEHDGFYGPNGVTYLDLKRIAKINENNSIKQNFGAITNILMVDEFIEGYKSEVNELRYKITSKGIAFLFTDNYVDRKKGEIWKTRAIY
jgi:hypothetical protein